MMTRTVPAVVTLLVLAVVSVLFSRSVAEAKGGDEIAPFPVVDTRADKQEAKAMAIDSDGNIIAVGYTSSNSNDYWVVKLNADGSGPAWAEPATFGGSGADVATAVAVDTAKNIIVTGYTWNGTDYDVHTVKYSGVDGSVLWQHTFDDGTANGNDMAIGVAVDASDDIYVAGTSANGTKKDDFLIIKYPSAGNIPTWQELYDDVDYPNNDNRILALAVGGAGIAVTGYSSKGGADFDVLTRKYGFDKTLVRQWRHSSTGSADDRGLAVKLDSLGNVVVAGYVSVSASNTDMYTVKYDPASDTPIWAKTYGGNGIDEPRAIWLDSADEVFVTGYTTTLSGNQDYVTLRYASAPGDNPVWVTVHDSGNGATDIPFAITGDNAADGGVFAAGYTNVSGNENFLTLKYRKDNGIILWQKSWNGSGNKHDRAIGIGLHSRNVCVAGWSDGATSYDFVFQKYDFGALNAPNDLVATVQPDLETSIILTWTDNSSNEDTFFIQRKLGEGGTYADIVTDPVTLPAGTTTYTDTGLSANNYYYYRVRAFNAANGDSNYSNEARALTKIISYQAPAWDYLYDGNSNEDYATSVAVGSDDHPVVTGYSLLPDSGADSFDYITIKLNRATKAQIWKTPFDSGDNGNDSAESVAVDGNNDVLVTGTAYLFLAGGEENSDDLYTTKYLSATGAQVTGQSWPGQYGTANYADSARAIVTGPNNSSVVIGQGMNGGAGLGNFDIYVIKYNVDGSPAWAQTYIYNSGRDDYPSAVAVDGSGDVLFTGYTKNLSGNTDWFTAKLNGSNGTLIWSDQVDGAGHGNDQAVSIAVDSAGDAYVTGFVVNASNNKDIHTVKYKGSPPSPPAAERVWEKFHDGPAHGDDRGVAVRIDPVDGAAVVGGTSYTAATDSDLYLIRYNAADGAVTWEENFDRPATYDYATAMTLDSSGYIYLAGNSRGGVDTNSDFDATSNILSIIYDFEGTFLGAIDYNGAANRQDEAKSVTANYRGEAFIAGFSRNATDIADYAVVKQVNTYILVPAPLTAVAQADYSKVDLSWRENTPGTSFRIWRTLGPSTSESEWTLVTTKSSGTITHTDTGLTQGTNYCYRVDAYVGSLNSRLIEKCVTTVLPAPVMNPLVVNSTTEIAVSWGQVTDNTGYKLERKTGAGGTWGTIATKAAGENSHTDTGLTPGTLYYYRVSTISAGGTSLSSGEVSAVTKPAAPVLNAPTGITTTQVTLGWTNVEGETGYKVERKQGAGEWSEITTRGVNVVSFTDTGLTSNTQYYYRVRASNASGDSAYSGEQPVLTLFTSPTLISAAGSSMTQIDLAWSNVEDETGYTVQVASCNYNNNGDSDVVYCTTAYSYWSSWSNIATPGADVTSHSHTGLSSGYAYKYRVIANTTGNSSAPSNEIVGWTHMTAPTLTIAPVDITSLGLSWTNILAATNYTLQRKQLVGDPWVDVTGAIGMSKSTTTFTNTGLAEQTNYYYRIRAYSTLTNGPPEIYSNEPNMSTPLPAPSLNAPVAMSTTQVDLSWNNITGNTGYEVERCTSANLQEPTNLTTFNSCSTIATLAADTVSYSSTGLTAGYTYRYRVRDTYTGGTSGWSAAAYATTIPPAPVLNVPTAASMTQIDLAWNNVNGETGYKLEWKLRSGADCTAGEWSAPISIAKNAVAYNHTGLTAATYYCYRIRAAYLLESDNSAERSQTTLLTAPTLNALTGVTISKIDLTWENVAGNTGYKVERSVDGGAWSQVGSDLATDVTTLSNGSLTAGTLYSYRVSAKNAGGYSAASNVQSTTTTPSLPVLTATVASASSITLSWPVVKGATEYLVEQKTGTDPYGSIGTVVKSYSLSYCGYPAPRIGCTSLTPDSAGFSVTGLTESTQYCFQIKAWNSTGLYSLPSTERCVTTSAMANQSLIATPVNSLTIRLDWTPVACAPNPCDDPDTYEIERDAWSGNWVRIKTVTGDTSTFIDTVGIDPLKTYRYRIRSYKGSDYSPYSNVETASTSAYQAGDNTCQ